MGTHPRRLLEPRVRPPLQRSRLRGWLGDQPVPGEDSPGVGLRAPDGDATPALDPDDLAAESCSNRYGRPGRERVDPPRACGLGAASPPVPPATGGGRGALAQFGYPAIT